MLGDQESSYKEKLQAWGKTKTLLGTVYQDPPTRHGLLPSIRATQVQRSLRVSTQVQYRSQDPWGPP